MSRPQPRGAQEEPDERLLVEAAQQDPGRFAELYEANFDRVYAFVARRVPDRQDVQDLTSEVFHQALANIKRFEWRGSPFATWLFRIAANAIADHYQRSAKREQLVEVNDPGEDIVEEMEQQARLFRFVRRLPAEQRLVITLRFAEEKSIREIAHELGRSEGAVRQLQFRALQTLRSRMRGTNG
jgi:RNA polymerase sigma-70 factor (ECF subfamily)